MTQASVRRMRAGQLHAQSDEGLTDTVRATVDRDTMAEKATLDCTALAAGQCAVCCTGHPYASDSRSKALQSFACWPTPGSAAAAPTLARAASQFRPNKQTQKQAQS